MKRRFADATTGAGVMQRAASKPVSSKHAMMTASAAGCARISSMRPGTENASS